MSEQLKIVFLAYAAYGARRPSGSSLSVAASGSAIPAFPLATPSASTAEIDGARFSKLVRAAGLLDASSSASASSSDSSNGRKGSNSKLTPADVDLAFAQACASTGNPASKKLRFDEFVKALKVLARRGGFDEGDLVSAVASSGGPRPSGEATVPDFVRFHDDKSTYTGVHARGGPTKFDGGRDLAALCDRSQADVRGVSSTFARPR